MPRKPRITLPGFYHVISRGVERRNVYLEDEDFEQFLDILATDLRRDKTEKIRVSLPISVS